MSAIDVHQHLWNEGVLAALAQRTTAPRARHLAGPRWTVELPGEPPFEVDLAAHDPELRARAVRDAGLDRALVCLSSPVGVEALPPDEARRVLAAFDDHARELPAELGHWASLPLAAPADELAADAAAALDAGACGIVVGAAALATPDGLQRLEPVLHVLEARLAPLFVHPGPAPWGPPDTTVNAGWFAPATRYVAQLHAAWHVWTAWGREAHPGLHVLSAALAGLGPLHAERTALRGGPDLVARGPDPLVFYDTSSYGPRALRQLAAAVGPGQLVHGTDHPVVESAEGGPLFDDGFEWRMRREHVARLLGTSWVPA